MELTIEQAMQKIIDLQNEITQRDTEIEGYKGQITTINKDKEMLTTSNDMLKDINRSYYTQLNQQFNESNNPQPITNEPSETDVLSLEDLTNNFI